MAVVGAQVGSVVPQAVPPPPPAAPPEVSVMSSM
jgi:hypothetical protein